MPCDSCGHSKIAHREMTLSVYFCNQCQKVESGITFIPDRKVESSDTSQSGSTGDLLADLYWNFKSFKR